MNNNEKVNQKIGNFIFAIFNVAEISSRIGNTGEATLLRDLLIYYAV